MILREALIQVRAVWQSQFHQLLFPKGSWGKPVIKGALNKVKGQKGVGRSERDRDKEKERVGG